MKLVIRLYVAYYVLLIANTCLAQNGLKYRPEWHDGQRWTVEVGRITQCPEKPDAELVGFEPQIMRIIYEFEVVGADDAEGEKCTSIKLRPVSVNGAPALSRRYFQLLLRQSDLSLKKLQSLDSKTGDVLVSRSFEVGAIDVTDRVGFLPLVLPVFSAPTSNNELAKNDHIYKARGPDENRCIQSEQHVKLRPMNEGESTLLQRTFEHTGYDAKSRKVIQLWVNELPWWSEAKLEVGGKVECIARLTSIDGVRLNKAHHAWSSKIIDGKLGVETNAPLTVAEDASTNAVLNATNTVETVDESE